MLVWSLLSPSSWNHVEWNQSNEIMLNTMQNYKFDFHRNEFWTDWGVRFNFHSKTLHNFTTGLFSLYRGIFQLKKDTSILSRNGSCANSTCCSLTTLFVKTKIDFCCCNLANKQINKKSKYRLFVSTIVNR